MFGREKTGKKRGYKKEDKYIMHIFMVAVFYQVANSFHA